MHGVAKWALLSGDIEWVGIIRISWTERLSNVTVLQMVGETEVY